MKEELNSIKNAIDGLSEEVLENRRHGNTGDLVKVLEKINENLTAISFDLKDLVDQHKIANHKHFFERRLDR